jgi:predicted ATPase/DNA-binding SARP family transcriptional activator
MGSRCRISMFGSLQAQQGEREISRFRSERTGALLAYLAYHVGKPHRREALAETIWPGQTPRAGRTSLNTAVYSLRRQLEPPGVPRGTVIQSDRFAIQLNPSAVTTDVQEFEAALRRASDADTVATRVQHLTDAVRLYVGELLPGFYDDWIPVEQRRLAEQYFEAALRLSALLERTGNVQGALAVTREAIARDPLREEAHCELMRLYAVAGEPLAALRQYVELKDLLARELGQRPSPAAARLAQAIRAAEFEVRTPRPSRRAAATAQRPELPTGMVTFLLTDVEGAKALLGSAGEAFKGALKTYRSLLGREFRRHGAQGVRRTGTSFVAPFASATEAVECAVACQKLLAAHPWPPEAGPLRVRMALYTGDVRFPEGSDRDGVLDRASRVLSAAHGGQVLCGEATAALLKRDRGLAADLAHLGTYRLRDVPTPEKLFQVSYSGMNQVEFPPLRAEAGYADNLPLQLTRFFGREREREELRALLTGHGQRLVTLTGAGGTGKTRLALEVAREVMGDFDGAVWFVPLADLRDAELIPGAIADALGLQRSPYLDPLDQVAAVLREQSSLLILDNLEHLGQTVPPVVRSLLDRSRSTTCLATSRRALDLPGERLYVVAPLPTAGAAASAEELLEYASVRLFVDRAQAAKPDFQLTLSNAQTIATLCERLDGIPLAIELAAARAQAMTTGRMLAQLQRPFDFLVSRQRVAEERHTTLEAAIDWSYQLLPDELQRFFANLSVFRGGCTCEAAAAVCEEPRALEYLEELTASSLLTAEETHGVMRFRLLETLREYGRERLSPEGGSRLRNRHARYYLALAQEAEPELRGRNQARWLGRLAAEHDNFRASLTWLAAAGGGATEGLALSTVLARFWIARGYVSEGRSWLARFLSLVEDAGDSVPRARALVAAGELATADGDVAGAPPLLEQGLAMSEHLADPTGMAAALASLGMIATWASDLARAESSYTACLSAARQANEGWAVAMALGGLSLAAALRGEGGAARALGEERLAMERELGDPIQISEALHNVGVGALLQADYAGARAAVEECLRIRRDLQYPLGIGQALHQLGWVLLDSGDTVGARGCFEECRVILTELRFPHGLALSLWNLARIAYHEGDLAAARRLVQEAIVSARSLKFTQGSALSLCTAARIDLAEGDVAQARRHLAEGLAAAQSVGDQRSQASCVEALAQLLITQGEPEPGLRHMAAASVLRRRLDAPLPQIDRSAHERMLQTARQALGEKGFGAIWAAGTTMDWTEASALAREVLGDNPSDS